VNWIDRRIRECAEKQLPELALSLDYGVPEESQDRLRKLPPEIPKLTHLKSLIPDRQHIPSLPPEIQALGQLERLSVSDCGLTSVAEIATLSSLKQLDLSGSRNVIDDVSALKRLESLDVYHTRFILGPSGVDKLTSLRTLRLGTPFHP
jgi:Leucine-rich repeat (LRR) protein